MYNQNISNKHLLQQTSQSWFRDSTITCDAFSGFTELVCCKGVSGNRWTHHVLQAAQLHLFLNHGLFPTTSSYQWIVWYAWIVENSSNSGCLQICFPLSFFDGFFQNAGHLIQQEAGWSRLHTAENPPLLCIPLHHENPPCRAAGIGQATRQKKKLGETQCESLVRSDLSFLQLPHFP